MIVISRFAPSPTGRLHLGHAFSALLAHDFAKRRGGSFLLRIEDIDPGRCREEHVEGIFEDLSWLGLRWDGDVVRQSARSHAYSAALAHLRDMGLLYPCFCTRRDIAQSASAPHGDEGPVYPGTCRMLGIAERSECLISQAHCWRIDMAEALRRTGPLAWHDEDKGRIAARPELLGDVVLSRKDAPAAYHLAVTIDDAAQGVTDVVRGTDLFAATHVHRLLQALLGLPTPRYHHHPLIADEQGRRLAKRHGARSLADMRADGVDPLTLVTELRTWAGGIGSPAPSA